MYRLKTSHFCFLGFVENGKQNFLIVPISFVNDHIETLHELDIEYCKELAEKVSTSFHKLLNLYKSITFQLKIKNIRRCPAPNDHSSFIKGLADVVKDHLQSNEIFSRQLMLKCPLCTKASCTLTRQWLATL